MKTRIYTKPLVVVTERPPLSLSMEVERGGSPLEQIYDSTDNEYMPDRSTFPLTLTPIVTAMEPDTGKAYAVSFDTTASKWYVVEGGTETVITSATEGFMLESNLILRVLRNVPTGSPLTLRVRAYFTDTRRSEQLMMEQTLTLTTVTKAESNYTIRVLTPETVTYNPFAGGSSQFTFRAIVRKGQEDVTSQVKVLWYAVGGNNEETPIDDESLACLAYVGGQGTPSLVLDADYCDQLAIVCRIATDPERTEPDLPVRCYRTLAWKLPRIGNAIFSEGGSVVRTGSPDFTLHVLPKADGADMEESLYKAPLIKDRLVLFNWQRKATDSATVTDLGWGYEKEVPAADLRQGDIRVNTAVTTDVCVLEHLRPVTLNGATVTSPDGTGIIVCRNY